MTRFVSAGGSGLDLGRVEGKGLALASQSHLEVDGIEKRNTVNESTNMFTGKSRNLFNQKPAHVGRECVQIGNGDFLRVLCVGSLNLVFHMNTPAGESDFHVNSSEVYVLDVLSFTLFSLYHAQRKQHIVLNNARVYLFDGRLGFLHGVNDSSLSATRLSPSVLHNGMTVVYGPPPTYLPTSSVEDVVASPPPGFLPTLAGVVPSLSSGFQPIIPGIVPFTVSKIQPVLEYVVTSSVCGFPPASADATSIVSQALDSPGPCKIQPLEPFNDLRLMDMVISLDVGLMDGTDSVPPEAFHPPLLNNECLDSSAIEYLDASVVETMDLLVAQSRARILREEADCNTLHAAAVLATSLAAFAVGKPCTKIDINFFHACTGYENYFFMRETASNRVLD